MEANSEIKYIYSDCYDHLKFAETKHGGLIVFNGAVIIGVLSCYGTISHIICKPSLVIGIIALGISIIISIVSQFPKTSNKISNKKDFKECNLYFYQHLSQLNEDSFIEKFKLIDKDFEPNNFDKLLINQILVISCIATNKFRLFKCAIYPTIIGLGIITLGTIMKLLCR